MLAFKISVRCWDKTTFPRTFYINERWERLTVFQAIKVKGWLLQLWIYNNLFLKNDWQMQLERGVFMTLKNKAHTIAYDKQISVTSKQAQVH